MRKIIGGKKYDTDTSTMVWEVERDGWPHDMKGTREALYRKRTGEYFLLGEGGAMSRYARPLGDNRWGGGKEVTPITDEAARSWMEREATPEAYEAEFGEVDEERSRVVRSVSLTPEVAARMDEIAAARGLSRSALVESLVMDAE